MQYNSDSDSQDIVSLVGDATGLNTTADIKQITRAANRSVKMIWSWIFDSYGGWQYDDTNRTNMPVSTTALVSGQQQYLLPTEALTVRSVEFKNEAGDWTRLKMATKEQIQAFTSEKEWQDTAATPQWYAPIGDVLKLYPASDFSQADSLRVSFDRGSVTFSSGDAAQTPGFASEFHEAVADGASYFIGRDKALQNVQLLRETWFQWEMKIKEYYSKRYWDNFPAQIKVGDYTQEII